MSTDSDRREIYEKFKESKEYRDAFVAEHIYSRLPLKIRALREQRGWSQKDLGEKVGMAQAWVSKLEDPSYGKYTIATLLRLASAFDVGLDIDFKLFSQILDKALTLTPESFEVVSFTDDPGFLRYQASTAERSQDIGSSNRSHFSHPPHSNVPGNRSVKSGSPPGRIATIANTADTSVSLRPKDDKTAHERVEFGVYEAAGATV